MLPRFTPAGIREFEENVEEDLYTSKQLVDIYHTHSLHWRAVGTLATLDEAIATGQPEFVKNLHGRYTLTNMRLKQTVLRKIAYLNGWRAEDFRASFKLALTDASCLAEQDA